MTSSEPSFTIQDAAVFCGVLTELHLPIGCLTKPDLGGESIELYEAILRRTNETIESMSRGEPWKPDSIDLAAIRVVTGSILRHRAQGQSDDWHGYPVEEIETLRAKAGAALRRSDKGGWGSIAVWVGDARIRFPRKLIRDGTAPHHRLVAVPTANCWARVYASELGSADARDAALALVRGRELGGLRETIVEFDADSYWDLEQQAVQRARTLAATAEPSEPDVFLELCDRND